VVSWISQTSLQLVLLSVIIVGQNMLAAAAGKRSEASYNDVGAVLHEAVKIQGHLLAQDTVLGVLIGKRKACLADQGPGQRQGDPVDVADPAQTAPRRT